MFFGRERELQNIEREWALNSFGMPVIYGRRRIGKTAILEEFAKNKPVLFFTPVKDSENNIYELHRLANNFDIHTDGDNIPKILEDIFEAAKKRRFVFIIDEYPYLEFSNSGISSVLQKLIDKNYENSRLFLILCGSSMNFMKKQVLGYESPIFGRRTSQSLIEPFTFYESLQILPSSNFTQACELYGLVDGTPAYLTKLKLNASLRENLLSVFLNPSFYLFEEAEGLLKQELKNPDLYNSLLGIINYKSFSPQEIIDKMNNFDVDKNVCSKMIETLKDIGILKKITAWEEPRRVMWQIEDCYFKFWHTFMPKVMQAVKNGQAQSAANFIGKHYSEYMGSVFEKICSQWLEKESALNNLPINATNFGKWWGTDNSKKQQAEIDIVASDFDGNMIFGECKWRSDPMEADEIDKLIYRSTLVKQKENCKLMFYFFSKSGFSEAAIQKADEKNNCKLIDLSIMNSQLPHHK